MGGPNGEAATNRFLTVIAILGTIVYAVSAARYGSIFRHSRNLLPAAVVACFALLSEATIGVAVTGERTWHASWWEWHGLIVTAYLVVGLAARREWREERFRHLYLSTTRERRQEISVLFGDLVGFTTLSAELTAGRIIDFLTRIFSAFDGLAAEHGVEKIKTIGDAYMAAAGIPEAQSDHADRIAALAPRMLEAVSAIAEATKLKVQARIGIHTGPITAGVIGTHKFVYDVWGDTVNTASRMESYSLPGRIQVSAATRAALGDRFKLERRGMTEIKGKGMMETYFLNKR